MIFPHTHFRTMDHRPTLRGLFVALPLLCAQATLLGGLGVAHAYSPTDTDSGTEGDVPPPKDAPAPRLLPSTQSGDANGGPDEDGNGDGATATPYDHSGQFNIRLSFVGGYRMFFRYPASPYCKQPDLTKGDDQQKLCGYGAPFAVDVAAGFAPTGSVEPFLWGRFGLSKESTTDTKPAVILGGGIRVYTMTDSPIKVYLEPSLGVELEGSAGNPLWSPNGGGLKTPRYKTDVIGRFVVGPQFELSRNVGLYLAGGITLGVLRAIHSTMELEGGLQARFP